ncbi:MAG TPA: TauD/TfdA family dioxygenase [Luteimonas sp.]|nr:TauD/TfdA family dioxygenase [Luteimonas sp.]
MTFRIIPSGATLGARVEDLDLSRPLSEADFQSLLQALGRHGVLSYPRQTLTARQLRDFSQRFGQLEVNVSGLYQEPGLPEVMVLSNIVENGKPIGLSDAGQDWHTDMSYSRMIAFTNVLYGMKIPHRDGQPLGNTEFCNMHAAYDGLPEDFRRRLDGMTVLHDFDKFWEMMRRERGSTRPPLTAVQRAAKPPVSHPLFLTHPITGRKVLYCNPGYAVRINELDEGESQRTLDFLFAHQTRPEYRHAHRWQVGDLLMWDNMGTIHNAIPDYRPDEPRLIKRCQVMATRFFHDDGMPRARDAAHPEAQTA